MLKFLEKIESSQEELQVLCNKIRSKKLVCSNRVEVNGDLRFWDVDVSESPILVKFLELIKKQNSQIFGKNFEKIILMINHIDSQNSPDGSGGGWHVDSVRNQFKVFMYLTDCLSVENGPFTLFTSNKPFKDKFYVLKNYFSHNKFRFSDKRIKKMKVKGFKKKPVLESSLIPFMVNTSNIHRGEKISIGERIMVTAYMYDKVPVSIAKRIKKIGKQ